MTPEPLVLFFDVPPTPAYVGRFRRTDPPTSRAAAKQLEAPRDREVFMHLKITGQTLTPDQIADALGKYAPTVSSALSRLHRDGFVERFEGGVSARGNDCFLYRAAS